MADPKMPPKGSENNKDDKQQKELIEKTIRSWVIFMAVSLIGMWLFQQFILAPLVIRETQIPYSEFKAKIATGDIVDATLGQDRIVGTMKNPDATDTKNPTIPF